MSELEKQPDKASDGDKLTARDGVVGAAHAAQLADLGSPLVRGAAQSVGVADAAKIAADVAQGKEVRAIDVAGAAASVAMSAGIGGPALQAGAQGVALVSGLDAVNRGMNSAKALYDTEVSTPTRADVADRKEIEGRESGSGQAKPAADRARADVEALHPIDDVGESDKAVAAMARNASADQEYDQALKRIDPSVAEAVALATKVPDAREKSAAALREIERDQPEPNKGPVDWATRTLTSLKSIDGESDRLQALVAIGEVIAAEKAWKVELSRQDPTTSMAATLASERDQRLQVNKEDRKAADMREMGAPEPESSERLAKSLDDRMAKSELEERGWKDRDDLGDVMRDLERLASQAWQRAADLWEKYRPGDIDKPRFIDGDDAEVRKSPVKADNSVDREQREADRGQPEPRESVFLTPESIRKRFIQAENKYFYREEENRLAFEDKGKRLATNHNDPEVAKSMVELAQAKGWDAVKVKGTEEFKRVVWLQASLRGLEVDGFQPKAVDLAKLEELRKESTKSAERPATNIVEQMAARQRAAEPEVSIDRSAVIDEHHRTLSGQQRQAVESLKAILRERGDSEQAVNMAADVAAARFQNNRVHVGKILAHGRAPYENNPDNASSYFVKLQTPKGEKEIWGVDLRRAIQQSAAKVGDDVALAYQGRQKVTVPVKERDPQGKVVGTTEIVVDRNAWDVNRLDKVRDEVRKELTAAADRTDARQPLVKVYDRNAPREELRPEVVREHARSKERSR